MKIVLLESLGISEDSLKRYAAPLTEAGHAFEAYPKDTDPAVQIERAKDADVIMIANMPLKAEVINACENLKYIDVAFTGVDHVALDAARAKGVKVSNAAGYSTQAVAELALCMMISLLRNVPQVSERCRNGQTKDGLVGCELRGKTVGIVGAGAIGCRTAELCHAFGCKVLGNKRHVTGNEPSFIEFVSLEELLKRSDIVSLHCPLTDDTRHLINAERIGLMKQGAYLINTARGPVVDSEALAKALNEGRLSGAGIDVFENEPPLDVNHPLLHSKNTLVTPHVAFASAESMEARAEIVFNNIRTWMEGNQQNIIL
ncbi:2-hydroxyacid dehydrogenase [uncultured Bacteroides sp.]|uniref:2-hydroxyacid dehydrogenase n=1 Tax=uncultured Bacteroides sp. TaxID=162156 RepID=UPI00262E0FF3|nr:2-hydroxyacid dehydrogenase [uncultured Bacteroides sp.]